MKKYISIILVLILITYLVAPQTAYAATVKMSKSKVELNVGVSSTLKLIGAKGTIKWASSDNEVASVSKKGKVTAIDAGKATITATNNKKDYKCYVTVKDATVTVTVSSLLNYFDETAEYLSEIDFLKTVTNDDGTITYTMTKEQQQSILAFLKEYFCKEIDIELCADDYEGFSKTYTINDDATSFDVYVDKNEYLSTDPDYIALESAIFMLILLSASYQEYSGIMEADISFKFNLYDNDTQELLSSFDENS
jgi:hypothetical protein